MSDDYAAGNFRVLRGHDHIRLRPGMYIGDTGVTGLTHLPLMLVERALDCDEPARVTVDVELRPDGAIRVSDDGPPLVEPFAIPGGPRRVSSRLCGLEFAAPCALSSRLDLDTYDGRCHRRQSFVRGVPHGDAAVVGPTTGTGNAITLRPDPDIFTQTTAVPYSAVHRRLLELSALYPGLRFTLNGEVIHHPEGLAALFEVETAGRLTDGIGALSGTIETEDGRAALMFGWFAGEAGSIRSYANGWPVFGGEHVRGFRRGLSDELRPLAPGVAVSEVVRDGLVAVMAFELADLHYGGPTKDIVNNMEAFRLLRALTRQCLRSVLDNARQSEWMREWLIERA